MRAGHQKEQTHLQTHGVTQKKRIDYRAMPAVEKFLDASEPEMFKSNGILSMKQEFPANIGQSGLIKLVAAPNTSFPSMNGFSTDC